MNNIDRLNIIWGLNTFDPRSSCKKAIIISLIVAAALSTVVMGSLGPAGILPGPTIGWTILGLSVGGYILKLALGNLKERRIYIIGLTVVASTFVVLGALGGAGVLSATQVGWGVIEASLASPFVKGLFYFWNFSQSRSVQENGTLSLDEDTQREQAPPVNSNVENLVQNNPREQAPPVNSNVENLVQNNPREQALQLQYALREELELQYALREEYEQYRRRGLSNFVNDNIDNTTIEEPLFPDCILSYPRALEPVLRAIYAVPEGRELIARVGREGTFIIRLVAQRSRATWFPSTRTLHISSSFDSYFGEVISFLIFELNNGTAGRQFNDGCYLSNIHFPFTESQRYMSRNDFVRHTEFIEYITAELTANILDRGFYLGYFLESGLRERFPSFEEYFRFQQETGHSNYYYRQWDQSRSGGSGREWLHFNQTLDLALFDPDIHNRMVEDCITEVNASLQPAVQAISRFAEAREWIRTLSHEGRISIQREPFGEMEREVLVKWDADQRRIVLNSNEPYSFERTIQLILIGIHRGLYISRHLDIERLRRAISAEEFAEAIDWLKYLNYGKLSLFTYGAIQTGVFQSNFQLPCPVNFADFRHRLHQREIPEWLIAHL